MLNTIEFYLIEICFYGKFYAKKLYVANWKKRLVKKHSKLK